MPDGKLKFQFRAEHDVVIVTVDWRIETEHDLDPWYQAYAQYFRKNFKRKVDVIIDLTNFQLSPKVAQRFGEVRAKLLRDYTNRSYRVRLDPFVKTAALGNAMKITATPTLVFADGSVVPGALPLAQIEKEMVAAEAEVKKVASTDKQ